MIQLRTFSYIDILQPQLASFLQVVGQGFFPLEDQASLFVEVAPGMSINVVTDVALKRTSCYPSMQIVERAFGLLELHHTDQGQVREAGQAILEYYGLKEEDRIKPVITASQIITGIEPHQAMLINRMRKGQMLLENQTLYILELNPAGYAAVAANEAEKHSPINLLEMRAFGAFGRLYLGGYEENIKEAVSAIENYIEGIKGKENPMTGAHS